MSTIYSKCSCGNKTEELKQGATSGRLVCQECFDKEYRDWRDGAELHPDVAAAFGNITDKKPGVDDFDDDEIF